MSKVIVADKRGATDGAMFNMLNQVNSSLDILLVSRPDGYVFNEDILSLKGKPYAIADVIEMGWDAEIIDTPFLGFPDTSEYSIFNHPQFNDNKSEWQKLNDFIKENKQRFYLKRELLLQDQEDEVFEPLNYPAQYPIPEPQSKEDFLKRPLDVFYSWGLSHPQRRRLQGDIWLGADKYGYMVGDNLFWIELFMANESGSRWLSVNIPHYCRFHSDQILNVNALAKISISMPGAGTSCFRHTESSSNAVMLMKNDNMAWSFPWEHNKNCIMFNEFGGEVETCLQALSNNNLYDIYRAGVENCKKYYLPNYINHIESIINNA